MQPLMSRAARTPLLGLALFALMTGMAVAAAPVAGPGNQTRPGTSPSPQDVNRGDATSPGDSFTPWRPNKDKSDEPGRPQGGGRPDRPERADPVSSKGMSCDVRTTSKGVEYFALSNDSGATIPAGSTVTIYVQPGNIRTEIVLAKDWPAGGTLQLALRNVKLPDGATCSVRIGLRQPPAEDAPKTPIEEPQAPPADEPPQPVDNSYETGDTGPVDAEGKQSAACSVDPDYGQVHLVNSGTAAWPDGTTFTVTLPNGEVFTVTAQGGYVPGGSLQLPDDLIYGPGGKPDVAPYLPEGWTCNIEMTLPTP